MLVTWYYVEIKPRNGGESRGAKLSDERNPRTKPCPRPQHPSDGSIPRPTRRPTVSLRIIEPNRLQEAILGTFKRFDCHAMDMEALIYFTLQSFDVTPGTYEGTYKVVREHILKNFAIHQAGPLRLADINMYRLSVSVCYTDDTDV